MSKSVANNRAKRTKANDSVPTPTTNLTKEALPLVAELGVLGNKIQDLVSTFSLSTSSDISPKNLALWTGSTTSAPQILVAAECWTDSPPAITDLILSTLDTIEKKKSDPSVEFKTYRKGGEDDDTDPRLTVAQLSEPNRINPAAIIGLDLLPEGSFGAPLALSEFVEPFDQKEESFLLTPKYWTSDLHLDTSDGISAPLGSCIKMWLTFPPTKKNLALMAEAEGQKAKLIRIGKQLEGGMIFRTDSSQAIYLPACTLHVVYTLSGGFLIGMDLTTPSSSRPYAAMMAAGLDGDGDWQVAVFDRFLMSVDLGLAHNRRALAIKAWVDAEEWVREWSQKHAEWAKDAVKVWKEALAKPTVRNLKSCPCGKMEKGTLFAEHFEEEHSVRIPRSLKRRRGASVAAAGGGGSGASGKRAKRAKK